MSNNQRVMIVSSAYPYPPIDGNKLRIYNLFRHFPDGYAFDLITFGDPANGDNATLSAQLGSSFKNVELIPHSTRQAIVLSYTAFARTRNIIWLM